MYEDREGWERYLKSKFPNDAAVIEELMDAIYGTGDSLWLNG